MKKLAIALIIILALPLVFVPAAPADTLFPMKPGDVYTFSVSNHAGKGLYTVNSPVRTIANGKSYHVLVLFNPSGPHEEISKILLELYKKANPRKAADIVALMQYL